MHLSFNNSIYGCFDFQKAYDFIQYILLLSFDHKDAEKYFFDKIDAYSESREMAFPIRTKWEIYDVCIYCYRRRCYIWI